MDLDRSKLIEEVRNKIKSQNVITSDAQLARCLVETNAHSDLAAQLFDQIIKWRKDEHIDSLKAQDVAAFLISGHFSLPPIRDHWGRQVILIRPRFSFIKLIQPVIRCLVFLIETVIKNAAREEEDFVLMYDFRGMHVWQWDSRLERAIIETIQTKYPTRCAQIIMLSPPWFISNLLRIISPWMSNDTKERLFVGTYDNLSQFFSAHNILNEMNGTIHFEHVEWVRQITQSPHLVYVKPSQTQAQTQVDPMLLQALHDYDDSAESLASYRGNMTKWDGLTKQTRYCILHNAVFRHYEKQFDEKGVKPEAKGVIILERCRVEDIPNDEDNKQLNNNNNNNHQKHSFVLITSSNEKYLLVTHNEKEKSEWMNALNQHIRYANTVAAVPQ